MWTFHQLGLTVVNLHATAKLELRYVRVHTILNTGLDDMACITSNKDSGTNPAKTDGMMYLCVYLKVHVVYTYYLLPTKYSRLIHY